MNKSVESVEQYLNEVSIHLGNLVDKDQIITELRAHIWDLANKLAIDKGLSVQDAFDHAILRMEDPQILANKFLDEEPYSSARDWITPISTPESRVKKEQFLLIAIVGAIGVSIMAWIIGITSDEPFAFLTSFIYGLVVIGLFILALYFYDEKLFRQQITIIREKFLKPLDAKISQKKKQEELKYNSSLSTAVEEPSFWGALGEHLGGLIGGFFIGLLISFLIFNDLTQFLPLYNKNWYNYGAVVVYVSLGFGLLESAWLVTFGRIRYTRLISAAVNVVSGICAIIIVLYFPFTFGEALQYIFANAINDPDLVFIFGIADEVARQIIGIVGIIQFISAFYDVFKFGAWKPSDRKSLI